MEQTDFIAGLRDRLPNPCLASMHTD